jgi:V-type H+-transporting ATPase subunit a
VDEAGFLFSGQSGLQLVLLLVSFAAVPWMLVPKPLILKKRHEAAQASVSALRARVWVWVWVCAGVWVWVWV